MKILRKCFGGLRLTWLRLILFAVLAGLYTGLMALLPAARGTSFADISISFEWWILFGVLIILNSASAMDSALKCFVFFLISQPLVYLVQVPFSEFGWGLFRYYPPWLLWTALTLPMGFLGWYLKLDRWWGLLILTPILAFLGVHYGQFFTAVRTFFPYHLLSTLFCAATMLIYPAAIFQNPKIRRVGLLISVGILAAATVIVMAGKRNTYNTTLLVSGGSDGIVFDDTCTAALKDESFGTVEIVYDRALQDYRVDAELRKMGKTELILTYPDGRRVVLSLTVRQESYHTEVIEGGPASDEARQTEPNES